MNRIVRTGRYTHTAVFNRVRGRLSEVHHFFDDVESSPPWGVIGTKVIAQFVVSEFGGQ